jgi:predicted DsbA family dithiol-disulfide isomerase
MYSDIHCPWTYMALYRMRIVWPEYKDRLRVVFRSLCLELKNQRSTPKPIVDAEIPLMKRQEPDLPMHDWTRPEWRYVPTFLPAFEGLKAAEMQGDDLAWEFSWQVRHAFFAENRTVCMRFELEKIARTAGLDVDRFQSDWDSGLLREKVLAENHEGWEVLKVAGSPTFVLPSGRHIANPGAGHIKWGRNFEILEFSEPEWPNGDRLQVFRDFLDEAVA